MARWAIEHEADWAVKGRCASLGDQHDYLYEALTNITISSFTASKKNETPMQLYFRNARLTLLKQRRLVRDDFSDQPNASQQLSRIKFMLKHIDSKLRNLRRDAVLERIFFGNESYLTQSKLTKWLLFGKPHAKLLVLPSLLETNIFQKPTIAILS